MRPSNPIYITKDDFQAIFNSRDSVMEKCLLNEGF